MIHSRSLRRFVAGAVAVLFLACHGTASVYAGARDLQQPGAAQESCHEAGEKSDLIPVKNDCQVNCATQINSMQPGAAIFDSIDLPPVLVFSRNIVAASGTASPIEPRLLRVESPPLPILHCCLRN